MSKKQPMDEWDERKWAQSRAHHEEQMANNQEYRTNYLQTQLAVHNSKVASSILIDARRELRPLEDALAASNTRVLEEVANLFGIPRHAVHLGGWECRDSPTGFCIYDTSKDSSHDYCLVCHDPSERK